MSISWTDVKLGLRMLVKYPGLSIVAVSGMALAIAIGAGYFAAFGALLDSTLPIEQGDRATSSATGRCPAPTPETSPRRQRTISFNGGTSRSRCRRWARFAMTAAT